MTLYEWAARHHIDPLAFAELQAILSPFAEDFKPAEIGESEAAIGSQIEVMAPKCAASLWRNNSGVLKDEYDTPVRFGLGNRSSKLNKVWKSSDYIGITTVVATYVGQQFGVFTAVETKRPGWKQIPSDLRAKGQANFMATVKSMGGLAGFAQSVEEYKRIIGR